MINLRLPLVNFPYFNLIYTRVVKGGDIGGREGEPGRHRGGGHGLRQVHAGSTVPAPGKR